MAEFREPIETILFGVMRVTKAVIPIMCEQRAGHILHFISFRGSIGGSVGRAPCSAAKWAVEGFSEVLANEVGALGLKVNVIEPGEFPHRLRRLVDVAARWPCRGRRNGPRQRAFSVTATERSRAIRRERPLS